MCKVYSFIAIAVVCACICGCSTVKPYQKQFLNDHYMQQSAMSLEKLESEAINYREGAAGGESGKTGGGCGCN